MFEPSIVVDENDACALVESVFAYPSVPTALAERSPYRYVSCPLTNAQHLFRKIVLGVKGIGNIMFGGTHETLSYGVYFVIGDDSLYYKRLWVFFGRHKTQGDGCYYAIREDTSDTIPTQWNKA